MAHYFSYLPNIKVGIPEPNSSLKNYVEVKNLFRRVKAKSQTLRNLTYFEKYSIPGDDKPYNVSYNVYGTPKYEWLILLVNDIVNIYKEWPLSSVEFEIMIRQKYGTQGELQTHHYETKEIRDLQGNIIIPAGLTVNQDFTKTLPTGRVLSGDELIDNVTFYEYEKRLNESKRDIYMPYPSSLFTIENEMKTLMQYKRSIDTSDNRSNIKNSGDDDYYLFQYFTSGISN